MVQDFRTETDQRSPAPPHFDRLLQGKLTNGTEDERTNTMSSNKSDYAKDDNKVSEKGNASPRLHRRMPSKREKKNRSKTYSGAEVSLLRRLRSTKDSGAKTPEGRMDDDLLEARIEEGVKRRAFLHYDVQSVYFDLPDIIRIVQNPERKRSTLTGASAASSRQQPNTPSTPTVCNVGFVACAAVVCASMRNYKHQNYFGIDNILGPVALSVRREKLNSPENPLSDNGKDSTARYLYRIILRTSELNTLRGYIMEDSIPSSAKHNTSRGLPLRDVLEYVVPDLPLTCLKVANNSEKTREHLCKLDEQGLSNKYKIGILYCRAGQGTEEEMYNNEHSGPAFDEFLECVGEKVKLKGFVKYRAQLDNRTDSTGPHSIYAYTRVMRSVPCVHNVALHTQQPATGKSPFHTPDKTVHSLGRIHKDV
ncbi:putative signal-induced proliferation-associated 1-like protein 2 isoform X3 [Apostichopus japonicus]|uniref:Putative signal-induced proliferation-associated 1-like protein 2 isoform X3 n=1 Tax=Stichopus japonicus TaxID=307972 RepID=A0A2G8K9L3_STIJA|nr:putative signal-induced proliferation-associated 1-like protein 2 isoform X3 [Apostichopus japonicus]